MTTTLQDDVVYLARVPVDGDVAPASSYRALATAALGALDLPGLPATGTVLLKANATVLYRADRRIITHPAFLAGLVESLGAKGVLPSRIEVGDGQTGEHPDGGHTWKASGYTDQLAAVGAGLVPFNDTPVRDVEVEGGVVYDRLPIYTAVADCAYLVNVPLAKCHNLACTTLGVKNLMGILGRPERHLCAVQHRDQALGQEALRRLVASGVSLFEERFCHKLCDLLTATRSLPMPRLTVVDGLIGRDGTAFNQGRNHPLGWSLVGTNEVHVDAVGTWLMGLDPQATPYLRVCAARGLGRIAIDEIEVVDLASGQAMDAGTLDGLRRGEPLMPISRTANGYCARFDADGRIVPWRIDDVNEQRRRDGLEPIPVEVLPASASSAR